MNILNGTAIKNAAEFLRCILIL